MEGSGGQRIHKKTSSKPLNKAQYQHHHTECAEPKRPGAADVEIKFLKKDHWICCTCTLRNVLSEPRCIVCGEAPEKGDQEAILNGSKEASTKNALQRKLSHIQQKKLSLENIVAMQNGVIGSERSLPPLQSQSDPAEPKTPLLFLTKQVSKKQAAKTGISISGGDLTIFERKIDAEKKQSTKPELSCERKSSAKVSSPPLRPSKEIPQDAVQSKIQFRQQSQLIQQEKLQKMEQIVCKRKKAEFFVPSKVAKHISLDRFLNKEEDIVNALPQIVRNAVTTMNKAKLNFLDKTFKSLLTDIERGKDEIRAKEELCCICLDASKSVLLLPCRHLCVCKNCSQNKALEKCPICCKSVKQKMEIFP